MARVFHWGRGLIVLSVCLILLGFVLALLQFMPAGAYCVGTGLLLFPVALVVWLVGGLLGR